MTQISSVRRSGAFIVGFGVDVARRHAVCRGAGDNSSSMLTHRQRPGSALTWVTAEQDFPAADHGRNSEAQLYNSPTVADAHCKPASACNTSTRRAGDRPRRWLSSLRLAPPLSRAYFSTREPSQSRPSHVCVVGS